MRIDLGTCVIAWHGVPVYPPITCEEVVAHLDGVAPVYCLWADDETGEMAFPVEGGDAVVIKRGLVEFVVAEIDTKSGQPRVWGEAAWAYYAPRGVAATAEAINLLQHHLYNGW